MLGVSARGERFTLAFRAETEGGVELSAAGREGLKAQPWEHLAVRLEFRVRAKLPDLDAEDESGYLEVYGKPGDVDDGGHEGAGHDGGVEADAVDDQRRDDTDDG